MWQLESARDERLLGIDEGRVAQVLGRGGRPHFATPFERPEMLARVLLGREGLVLPIPMHGCAVFRHQTSFKWRSLAGDTLPPPNPRNPFTSQRKIAATLWLPGKLQPLAAAIFG